MLQHVAYQLRSCLPERACVARLGGDEFAILTPAGRESVEALALAAAAAVADISFLTHHSAVSITASVGTALATPATATLAALLEEADATMYTEKSAYTDKGAPTTQTNTLTDRRRQRSLTRNHAANQS